MSKKKSATTMTLKDFHGGSIPSDLPLPSAPGVSVKPSQERPTAMSARSERTRHVSASPATISPLPAPPRVIGRHFDEDERTPFDAPPRIPAAMPAATGAWAQRKEQSNPATCLTPAGSGASPTVWSPSRVAQASAVEKVISGRWHSNSSSKSDQLVPPVSESDIRDSYASGLLDQRAVAYGSVISETRIRSPIEQNRVMSVPGSGFDVKIPERTGTVGSEVNLPERTHVIGSGFEGTYGHGFGFESKQRPVARTGVIGENRVRSPAGPPEMRRVGSGSEDIMYARRQSYNNLEERPRSVGLMERKDKIGLAVDSEVKEIERPASHEGRFMAGPTGQKEEAERPRLKLLPRTKPIESQEIIVTEDKVGTELYSSTNVPVANDIHEMNENDNPKGNKGGDTLPDSLVHPNERPRLNLKPRSQSIGGQSEETGGKERPSVFGGGRPRELVLKERGVDVASDNVDKNLPSDSRPNSSSAKADPKPEPTGYESQQRNIRNPHTNQKEHHSSRHQHQPDTQKATWRDDTYNGTNNRRGAAHQNHHQQPSRPEPDTWRKPEPAQQEDLSGPRPGKGATALELAEAFSKRVSDVKRDPISRNPNPVVFSRLLGGERELCKGPSPHQQINGY